MSNYAIIGIESILGLQVINLAVIFGGAYMKKLTYDQSVITKEALQSFRSQGFSYAKIAEHFGVTEYTIKRAMIDYELLAKKANPA